MHSSNRSLVSTTENLRKRTFFRTLIIAFVALIGVALANSFLGAKSAASQIISSQEKYITYLLKNHDLIEATRHLNTLASSGTIYDIEIRDNAHRVQVRSSNNTSGFSFHDSVVFGNELTDLTVSYRFIPNLSGAVTLITVEILIMCLLAAYIYLSLSSTIEQVCSPIRKMSAALAAVDFTSVEIEKWTRVEFGSSELDSIFDGFYVMLKRLRVYAETVRTQSRRVAMSNIAEQVAHDIRSPLSALRFAVQLESVSNFERDQLIGRSIERISAIADDLIQQGRNSKSSAVTALASHDSENAVLEPVLISELIEGVIAEKKFVTSANPLLQLIADIPPELETASALANKHDLSRVVSNLVNNSIEALEAKGGTVKISVRSLNRNIVVVVTDDGCGMSEDVQRRFGDRGFSTKSSSSSGSGLGVFHARSFVERCGGRFQVQSGVGRGTMISMNFQRA